MSSFEINGLKMEPVTIFIDESFEDWMGLKTLTSNFAYGVVFVPTANLKAVQAGWIEIEEGIRKNRRERNLPAPEEIKFKAFRDMRGKQRSETLAAMQKLFFDNRVYFMAFFSTVEGMLNHGFRDENFDNEAGFAALTPNQKLTEIEGRRDTLLAEWQRPENKGDFILTETIFKYLGGTIGQYREAFFTEYSVVIDARGADDVDIERCFRTQLQVFEGIHATARSSLLGINFEKSEREPIIHIADFVAGMVRKFFRENPDILEDQSSLSILSAKVNRRMVMPGFYEKTLSPDTVAHMKDTIRHLLPNFPNRLANGLVSAFAKFGEARVFDFGKFRALDMAD